MADPSHTSFLPPVVMFCAAAVIAVPVARLAGLSSVIGYLFAGVAIGPSGLAFVSDPTSVRTFAELGVVMLLFVIGLELRLSKLISLRRDIFVVGLAQVAITAAVAIAAGRMAGLGLSGAIITGLALALSATAVALQILGERGALQSGYGQRTFAILLFQDLSIVPILALVPVLAAPVVASAADPMALALTISKALGALALLVFIGRYLLNPFFGLLSAWSAREVMTAAALLVVLGAALLMEHVGLSMALGAFVAGLLLAESNFKHQLEADIEPFRGLLLGLFFMSVGMGIDLRIVAANLGVLAAIAASIVVAKVAIAYGLVRATGSSNDDALRTALLLAPAGEFSFVLIPLAAASALIAPQQATLITAAAAISMFLGPILAKLHESWIARRDRAALARDLDDMPQDDFADAHGSVLVIGFGRFGQLTTQVLLADGADITVIDNDMEIIRVGGRFGIKIYYGDGRRLDVLRAAGAAQARVIAVCVEDRKAALDIVDLIHAEFPLARSYVRAYDRVHAIELLNRDVDFQMRETVESALAFGRATLQELGVTRERAQEIVDDVRKRDMARLSMQRAEGLMSGAHFMVNGRIEPEPLTQPKARSKPLSPETRNVIDAESPVS